MVLRVGGLATGMDIDSILKDLMTAERIPLDKVEQQRQLAIWTQEDYREINNALRELRDATFNMKLQGTYLTKSASSTNETVATATATSSANTGSYSLIVDDLATAAYRVSQNSLSSSSSNKIDITASLDSQSSKLNYWNNNWTNNGIISFEIKTHNQDGSNQSTTFTFDPSQDSLNDVINEINNSSLGLTAFYDAESDKISLMRKVTGDNNPGTAQDGNPEIEFVSGNLYFLTKTMQFDFGWQSSDPPSTEESGGTDAEFTLNGLSTSRKTNQFSLNGINFDLKQGGGNSTTITVRQDTEDVYESITSWVEKYNEVLDKLNGELTEKRYRDYRPLTDIQKDDMSDREIELWEEKAKSGLLANDSMLSGIVSDMRNVLGSALSGLSGSYSMLSQLGIKTENYSERGKLHIDESKLREALQNDLEGVMEFFTNSGAAGDKGLAVGLYDTISKGISSIADRAGSTSDFSLVDNSFMGKQVRRYDERIQAMQDRLKQVEDRYWRQFTAMERAISQMNAQSAWLSQQLGLGQ